MRTNGANRANDAVQQGAACRAKVTDYRGPVLVTFRETRGDVFFWLTSALGVAGKVNRRGGGFGCHGESMAEVGWGREGTLVQWPPFQKQAAVPIRRWNGTLTVSTTWKRRLNILLHLTFDFFKRRNYFDRDCNLVWVTPKIPSTSRNILKLAKLIINC